MYEKRGEMGRHTKVSWTVSDVLRGSRALCPEQDNRELGTGLSDHTVLHFKGFLPLTSLHFFSLWHLFWWDNLKYWRVCTWEWTPSEMVSCSIGCWWPVQYCVWGGARCRTLNFGMGCSGVIGEGRAVFVHIPKQQPILKMLHKIT